MRQLVVVLCILCSVCVIGDELAFTGFFNTGATNTGGTRSTLVLKDDLLIQVDGALKTFSITDRSNPRFLGALQLYSENGLRTDAVVCGDTVWTLDRRGLLAIDISDPENPALLSDTAVPGGRGFRLDANGTIAIIAHMDPDPLYDGRDVQVFDVTNPSSPVLLSSFGNLQSILDVAIVNDHAYISCETDVDSGLLVPVDLSDPLTPVVGAGVATEPISRMESDAGGMIAATRYRLSKVNLANPDLPVISTGYLFFEYRGYLYPFVVGDMVYVAYDPAMGFESRGIAELDVSGAEPVLLREMLLRNEQHSYTALAVTDDGFAYFNHQECGMTRCNSSLEISDLTDEDPVISGRLPSGDPLGYPAVVESDLWALGVHGFARFDISVPEQPRLSNLWGMLASPNSMLIHEDLIYLTVHGGMFRLEIRSVLDPSVVVGQLQLTGDYFPIVLSVDDDLLVVGGHISETYVIDVSDPAVPELVSTIPVRMLSTQMDGQWLYAVNPGMPADVMVFDLSDPADPQQVATVSLTGESEYLAYRNPFLYAVEGQNHIAVLDVTDPLHPALVHESGSGKRSSGFQKAQPSSISNAVFVGDRLVLGGDYFGSLTQYDISNPVLPVLLSSFTCEVDAPVFVATDGETVFVTGCGALTLSSWQFIPSSEKIPVPHVAANMSVWNTKLVLCNPEPESWLSVVQKTPATFNWKLFRASGFDSNWTNPIGTSGYLVQQNRNPGTKLVFTNLEEAGGGVAEFWLDGATSTDLTLMLPRYHAEHLTWTGFALMNTGETETDATLHIFDADGVDLGTTTIPIPATDRIVGYVQDYFPSVAIADGARITVTADQPLSGLTISGRENRQLLFTPAVTAAQPLTLQIPHIATALDYWDTMLIVDNTAAVARNISIQLYADGVAQVPIDHVVEAGSQLVFALGGAVPEATVDCGTVTVDGAGVIIREAFVSNPEKGTAEFLPGGQLSGRLVFSFPWYAREQAAIDWMGLAVMNATDHTLPVTAYAYNRDGELLALSHRSLGAMTRFVGYVEDLVPGATLTDVAMVIVETDSEEAGLCGLNISGHENERLLFTPARVLPETPAK